MSYTFLPSVYNPNTQNFELNITDVGTPNSYAQVTINKTTVNSTNDFRALSVADNAANTFGVVETYTDTDGNPVSAIYVDKNGLRYSEVFCYFDPAGTSSRIQMVWRDGSGTTTKMSTKTNPFILLSDFAASDDTVNTSYVTIPTSLGNYRIFSDVISVTFAGNLATFVMPFSISIRGVQAASNDTTSNTNIIAVNWSGTTITLRASANGLINVNLSVVGYV